MPSVTPQSPPLSSPRASKGVLTKSSAKKTGRGVKQIEERQKLMADLAVKICTLITPATFIFITDRAFHRISAIFRRINGLPE